MRSPLMSLSLVALIACGGGKGGTTSGSTLPPPPTTQPCDSASDDTACGGGAPSYLDPVAVGFEIEGLLNDDGTFSDLRFEDGSTIPPILILTFADAEFFSLSSDQQDGHFCQIAMSLNNAVPQDASNPAFNTQTGAVLNWSYDLSFTQDIIGLVDCGPMVDPDVWGPNAIDLTGPFEGAHIGIGFAPMTDYLWNAFDGGYTAVYDYGVADEFYGVYVAVNDRDGNWGGCDWTMTRIYEVDANDILVDDPDNPGYLRPLKLDTVGTGPLPRGYMINDAYWYQDFPLMDFTNLSDPPVGQTSWLCE